jgi:hypothetical protein
MHSITNYRPITTAILIPLCVRRRLGFNRYHRLMFRQWHNTARQKRHKYRNRHAK